MLLNHLNPETILDHYSGNNEKQTKELLNGIVDYNSSRNITQILKTWAEEEERQFKANQKKEK